MVWLTEQAIKGKDGQAFWWVAPVFGQAEIAFRRLKRGLPAALYKAREQPPIITLKNGASLWFKGADNPDSLYGEDVYAAVIDEASRVREGAWVAVRSTLTATRGPVRIIGNVRGRANWAFRLARRAEAGEPNMEYHKLIAKDAVDAGILTAEEVEDARRNLPEQVFRELYLAEPSDDGGNPFGIAAIAACVGNVSSGKPVVWGWDLAKSYDWTVGIALDREGRVCRFSRWQAPWEVTTGRILAETGDDEALVDSTGVGDPIVSRLQSQGGGNFSGYHFNSRSKQQLMEGLAVAIQQREITYPDGPIRAELDQFEFEYTRTGVRYSAPEGAHDDCVCSLALARQRFAELNTGGGSNVIGFYRDMISRMGGSGEAAIEAAPAKHQLPWHEKQMEQTATPDDNDMVAAYAEAVSGMTAKPPACMRCGKAIGATRISDGVFSWHPECR